MKTRFLQPTEHEIQAGIVRWCNLQSGRVPALKLLFAIPNGGWRHISTGAKLKAEGVKAGVPDLFLPYPALKSQDEFSATGGYRNWHGLFLEVKRGTMGRVREAQEEWGEALTRAGYRFAVVRNVGEAIEIIQQYLNLKPTT